MYDVVELCDGRMPDFGPGESVLALDLGTKVSEEDDGGLVGAKEEGANEEVGCREGSGVTVGNKKIG